MKRKSMEEIRLEERVKGFYDCLSIFEDYWRSHVKAKIGGGVVDPPHHLFPIISKAQESIREDDNRWRDLIADRINSRE